MAIDLLITCHLKDVIKLPFVINAAVNNIADGVGDIHIVTNDPNKINAELYKHPHWCKTTIHGDEHVLPDVSRESIGYRPNWIFQQLVKLTQEITQNSYLCLDADAIINRPLRVINNGKPSFFLGKDQNHQPYFDWSTTFCGVGREYPHSFISELMYFDKGIRDELFDELGYSNMTDARKGILSLITPTRYLSEYEFFGNAITKYYPNTYDYRHIATDMNGKEVRYYGEQAFSEKEVVDAIEYYRGQDIDIFTLHTWA